MVMDWFSLPKKRNHSGNAMEMNLDQNEALKYLKTSKMLETRESK